MNNSQAQLHKLLSAFGARAKDGELVLDAGAGSQPYRKHFSHLRYESADLPGCGDQTYECDLHNIPVSSDRYSLVICSQVLEHVQKPFEVLRELNRVCKPGGLIFYSVPFYYFEHNIPYDYYRYTSYGCRLLAEEAGFEVVKLGALESYLSTVSLQLSLIKKDLPRLDQFVQQDLCDVEAARKYDAFIKCIPNISRYLSDIESSMIAQDIPLCTTGHPKNNYVIARKTKISLRKKLVNLMLRNFVFMRLSNKLESKS